MANLSIEAIAILCYTAIALFLSLYFVPFKVVPRAWAKAVRTPGHPAKLALDGVLDGAVKKMAEEKGPIDGLLTAKLAAIKMPEAPKLEGLQIQIDQTTMEAAMENVLNKRKMAGVRDARTPSGEIDPEELERLRASQENPEEAATLAAIKRWAPYAVENKLIKAKTAKIIIETADEAFRTGNPIAEVAARFGIPLNFLGAPSVSLAGGGAHRGGGPV